MQLCIKQASLLQLSMSEYFSSPTAARRDTYQAQTSGGSVDYDYDKVQVQASANDDDANDDDKEDNGVQKRSVKIDLTQKANALPDGTSNLAFMCAPISYSSNPINRQRKS